MALLAGWKLYSTWAPKGPLMPRWFAIRILFMAERYTTKSFFTP